MFVNISGWRGAAAVLLPKQHIFFLSHMRAYTSLMGHIMGSNPTICGYYEMHIGYHSWKSLIRQKLLYFEEEVPKPGFRYMFDKVLHNDHNVAVDLLNSARAKTIFSLRHPRDTLPSILKLYAKVDPAHEFNSEAFATRYYIERLELLSTLSSGVRNEYFYLDAETIKLDTDNCLAALSDFLALPVVLSPDYEIQQKTSRERYGDTSGRLQAGSITTDAPGYDAANFDAELLAAAEQAYQSARALLLEGSSRHCILPVTNH